MLPVFRNPPRIDTLYSTNRQFSHGTALDLSRGLEIVLAHLSFLGIRSISGWEKQADLYCHDFQ